MGNKDAIEEEIYINMRERIKQNKTGSLKFQSKIFGLITHPHAEVPLFYNFFFRIKVPVYLTGLLSPFPNNFFNRIKSFFW